MSSTVNGVVKAPDAHGIIQGDGGLVDKIAGDANNNILQGHALFNQYFGSAGNDTFVLSDHFARSDGNVSGPATDFHTQTAYIADFHGAGTTSGEQDFIALQGYDPGTLQLLHTGISGTPGAVLYYYTVNDDHGNTFNFMINSLDGQPLDATQRDFQFY